LIFYEIIQLKIIKTRYKKIKPFVTKDGSLVRELMHPDVHGNATMSFAEAIVPVGGITLLHRHFRSEEIYHITQGEGRLFLEDKKCEVKAGDTILIPPGAAHKIKNTGKKQLKILCCSSPPYSHEDTELFSDSK
jgi:mannose-6-phosphate isomerase-like protein (cupin superfamily)